MAATVVWPEASDLLGLRERYGEEVTITRHGRPVAVLVRPDVMRSRANVIIEDAGRVHELIAVAAASELPTDQGLTPERAEELIGEIRSGRDSG